MTTRRTHGEGTVERHGAGWRARARIDGQRVDLGTHPTRDAAMAVLAGLPVVPPPAPRSYVYFVRQGERGPIKIGFTRRKVIRFASLQSGNPEPLRLLCCIAGGSRLESLLHRHFAEQRLNGEWFVPNEELLLLIEELSQNVLKEPS
jgi:hypothetical protein